MSVSEKGVCSICDEVFNDSDLTEIDDLFLCAKDLEIYKNNEWEAIKSTTVSDSNMKDALILQDMKDEFKKQGKPSYIKSTYNQSDTGEIITISDLYITKG